MTAIPPDKAFAMMATGASERTVDQELLGRSVDQLKHTKAGRGIARDIASRHISVKVVSDVPSNSAAAGAWDPATSTIWVRRDVLLDPRAGAALLAHEGTHARDEHRLRVRQWHELTRMPVDATREGGAFTPFTASHSRGQDIEDFAVWTEVNAYRTEARVQRELGQRPDGLAATSSGGLRTRQQTADAVRADPLYAR